MCSNTMAGPESSAVSMFSLLPAVPTLAALVLPLTLADDCTPYTYTLATIWLSWSVPKPDKTVPYRSLFLFLHLCWFPPSWMCLYLLPCMPLLNLWTSNDVGNQEMSVGGLKVKSWWLICDTPECFMYHGLSWLIESNHSPHLTKHSTNNQSQNL